MKSARPSEWVPTHPVDPSRLRVIDFQVKESYKDSTRALLEAGRTLADAHVLADIGPVIDPLLRELDIRARLGVWPRIPRSVTSMAAFVGTSVAVIERKADLYEQGRTHPAVHLLLCVMAARVADGAQPELAQIPLEAAYLAVRDRVPVESVLT